VHDADSRLAGQGRLLHRLMRSPQKSFMALTWWNWRNLC